MIIKRLVLVIAFAGGLLAQESPNQWTWGFANGRGWASMSASMKLGYVIGLWEGAQIMDKKHAGTSYKDDSTFGEQVTALDRFYQEPANAPIPVTLAMMLVTAKNNGTTTVELENRAAGIRQSIAKPDKPEEVKN